MYDAQVYVPPTRNLREEAYERALRSGLRMQDQQPPSIRGSVEGRDPVLTSHVPESAEPESAIETRAPDAFPRESRPPIRTISPHEQFLARAINEREATTYTTSRLADPISEYQLMAGTVIPAMLVTAMNSDMPGEILAQVSRNIFDSQQKHLLIPRGTRVIGRYDSQVALGQSRVLIAWTRLVFPDGRSMSLPGLPTQDLRGASGMRSQVDNHYARLYGQAVMLSIIGAAGQLSQPQQSSVLAPSSTGQVAAGALGQELSRISMETIRRNMDVRPTLEVRSGTPFNIFLGRDLVFEGPAQCARGTSAYQNCKA
jgi:type IV secretion system protein VirB10